MTIFEGRVNYNNGEICHRVISWFKQIISKEKSKVVKFDIVDFYARITEELMMKLLNY